MTETDWLGTSSTEGINPATAAIDTRSPSGIVAAIAAEDAKVASAVAAEGDVIAKIVRDSMHGWSSGGELHVGRS